MKKYKLKIKDDNAKWNNYGLKLRHNIGNGYVWFMNGIFSGYDYSLNKKFADEFTEEDINKLPYEFIQQHELIEVEEELYNIVCPYTNQILKRDKDSNSLEWDNSGWLTDTTCYQRQFTLKEIEEKYPDLEKWAEKHEKC